MTIGSTDFGGIELLLCCWDPICYMEIESCPCFLFISSWVVAQVNLGSVCLLLGGRQNLLLLRRCQLVLRYFVRSLEDRDLCRIGLNT